jgi:probable HAF family extracellular repeat protein
MYCRLLGAVASICMASGMELRSTAANAQNLLTDLGVATGHAINNNGQVALDQGIYSNGTITPLPALPGQTTPASALAINAAGQVAGSAVTQVINGGFGSSGTQLGSVAIAYSNGTLTNIALLFPEFVRDMYVEPGLATGINSGDQVVGYYTQLNPGSIDAPGTVGFIYANGAYNALPSFPPTEGAQLPYQNMPLGINDNGQITGACAIADPHSSLTDRLDAYIFDYTSGTWTDLGQGTGNAINAGGQVTGALDVITIGANSDSIVGTYAFLYNNGATTNLGTLAGGKNSAGNALNSAGQIVGSSDLSGSTLTHAFFYNGVMTDLNALISATDPLQPYVTLTSAVGINDSSLIVANGVDSRTNLSHAYLLRAPALQILPGALSFGTEAVGGATTTQSIVLTNLGTTSIALGAIVATSNFSVQSNNCAATIAPSAQCTIAVAFKPTNAGALTGGVTIPSAGTNYVVSLSGIAPIAATISPSIGTATVNTPVTITWAASPGSSCTAFSSSTTSLWTGSIAVSGSKTLTDTVAGTDQYQISCTAPGVSQLGVGTSVVWTWPAVTATLTALPTTVTAGQPTTLSWTSSNATSCSGTGGGTGDGWSGSNLPTTGSKMVSESYALAVPSVTLTFGITCTSSVSGLSGQSSANIVYNQPPPAKSGGGGALDPLWLMILSGVAFLNGMIQSRVRVRARAQGSLTPCTRCPLQDCEHLVVDEALGLGELSSALSQDIEFLRRPASTFGGDRRGGDSNAIFRRW